MNSEKRWYVVQVYTGYEDVVKADLEKAIVAEGAQDLFGRVLVPTGDVPSFDGDAKKEKIFPGYVLVEMIMNGEGHRIVKSLARVVNFLGDRSPVPMSDSEVNRIFAQMSGKLAVSAEKTPFVVGSEVTIASGPFMGFVGIVDSVDEDRKKITVNVSIFGRLTPVELGFEQVER